MFKVQQYLYDDDDDDDDDYDGKKIVDIRLKEINTKPVKEFQFLRNLFFSKISPTELYSKKLIDSQPR